MGHITTHTTFNVILAHRICLSTWTETYWVIHSYKRDSLLPFTFVAAAMMLRVALTRLAFLLLRIEYLHGKIVLFIQLVWVKTLICNDLFGRGQLAALRIFGGELGITITNGKEVLLLWHHPNERLTFRSEGLDLCKYLDIILLLKLLETASLFFCAAGPNRRVKRKEELKRRQKEKMGSELVKRLKSVLYLKPWQLFAITEL